jgi:ribosome biogenesis GTPase
MEGTILKGIGGFYYVDTGEKIYRCKARGIFRKSSLAPCVGDWVSIDILNEEEGIITEIHQRKNLFIRPPVANVDSFIITATLKRPELNSYIVDKFLVMAEHQHTDIIICLNKIDLADGREISEFKEIYEKIYPVVCLSGKTGEGFAELRKKMVGGKYAFAGPSGVGKSTLLNCLIEGNYAETGEIGEKSQKGKHTTRHVELFKLSEGIMIFDTPGFTSFEVVEAEEQELEHLYPEIIPYIGNCKYKNCRHIAEPGCEVRAAVKEGKIPDSRYESYCRQLKEIQEMRKY